MPKDTTYQPVCRILNRLTTMTSTVLSTDFSKLENYHPNKLVEFFESVINIFGREQVSASAKNVGPGDHVVFPRRLYDHHGIIVDVNYEGCIVVAEYTGPSLDNGVLAIIKEKRYTYAGLEVEKVYKMMWPKSLVRYSVNEIILRAKSRLGEKKYSLFKNNCEHFVFWCICGLNVSLQVKRLYIWDRTPKFSLCRTRGK